MIAAARLHAASLVLIFWSAATAAGAEGQEVNIAVMLSLAFALIVSTEEKIRRDR